jgi:hypothetical protein
MRSESDWRKRLQVEGPAFRRNVGLGFGPTVRATSEQMLGLDLGEELSGKLSPLDRLEQLA